MNQTIKIAKTYYENGGCALLLPYRNGQLHGISEQYYKSGNIRAQSIYVNGKRESDKEFYETGELMSFTPYKKGKEHGQYVSFFENGEPSLLIEYRNGFRDGKLRQWNRNGKLISYGHYENGKDADLLTYLNEQLYSFFTSDNRKLRNKIKASHFQ